MFSAEEIEADEDVALTDKIIALYRGAKQPDLVLNELQVDAILSAALAIEQRQDFTIHGCAGTGKTVVLAHLARMYPSAYVVAPTGKAAIKVGERMGRTANTIHSLFYTPIPNTNPIRFESSPKIGFNSIILLDEASMVTEATRRDIKKTYATIIACGDPAQLKPVLPQSLSPTEAAKFAGGFQTADVTLTEIHRQAQTSPIIRQATRVRNGQKYRADGEDFRIISPNELTAEELSTADAVLCWKNETVDKYNNIIRTELGYSGTYAEQGEPVLCLHNCPTYGVMNGGIYTAVSSYDPDRGEITLLADGLVQAMDGIEWNQRPRTQKRGKDGEYFWKSGIKLGYAMTVHKSQGSEWDNIILIDEYPEWKDDRANWLYTAITRAAKRITIVRMA